MKKRTKIILALCLALLLAIGIGCWAYISDYYRADDAAVSAMAAQTGTVHIEQCDNVTWFVPDNASAGLIFYPGGKVEASAYAPLLRACAEQKILCALVQMPANLAVLDMNAADGLRQQHHEVKDWYIAGHSLGGAMAASYAAEHAEDFSGLVLLAAYSTADLTGTQLRALSVYGSEDGVLDRDAYAENRANLPSDTVELVLEGGCHAQFGSYGEQDGDGEPTMSGEEQLRRTAAAIASFALTVQSPA